MDWELSGGNDWPEHFSELGLADLETMKNGGALSEGGSFISDFVYIWEKDLDGDGEREECWALQSSSLPSSLPVPQADYTDFLSDGNAYIHAYAYATTKDAHTFVDGRAYTAGLEDWSLQGGEDDVQATVIEWVPIQGHPKVESGASIDGAAMAEIEGTGAAVTAGGRFRARYYFDYASVPQVDAKAEVEESRESEAHATSLSFLTVFGISGTPTYTTGQGFDDSEDQDIDALVYPACEHLKVRLNGKAISGASTHSWTAEDCVKFRAGAYVFLVLGETFVTMKCP